MSKLTFSSTLNDLFEDSNRDLPGYVNKFCKPSQDQILWKFVDFSRVVEDRWYKGKKQTCATSLCEETERETP
jgi:hypothetical protein